MKRILALVLTILMMAVLTACGQSEAAKAVDEQIAAIGEVTLDSNAAISAAEAALRELSPEDQKQVKHTAQLEEARSTYDGLLNQSQADEIDAAITAIGTVTLESGEAVDAARALYDDASEEVKALVQNAAALEAAEDSLADLRSAQVAELINAIGEVTLESREAINAAQTAYDALSTEEQAKVSNAGVLKDAAAAFKALEKDKADALLRQMTKEEDKVRGLNFYYPSGFPRYSDGWAADKRSFVLPYMGQEGDRVWVRIIYNYTADDWVFFKKVTIAADDQRFYKSFSYFDVSRDNGGGRVWESMDDDGTNDIDMLWAIANSKEAIVRFEGDDYYRDITIRDSDKEAIRQLLTVYEALNG